MFMSLRRLNFIVSTSRISPDQIGMGGCGNSWSLKKPGPYHVLPYWRHGLLTLALILAPITLASCMRKVISTEQVDKMIRDQVPIGSDKQQVKAFIDNLTVGSLRIFRGDFGPADPYSLGSRDPEKVAELGDRLAEFAVVIIYRAQSDGILTFDDIIIAFYADKAGRLIGYTVKMVGAK